MPQQSPNSKKPRRPTSPDGILVIDKPAGITSHDVVARLRRLCGTRAVGHGGTLDPMATGVLICGIGKGTKLLTYVSGSDKAYSATIRLGISTTTDDAEGETISTSGANSITDEMIHSVIHNFIGEIAQVPTSVSAIKVNGKRAYDLVRGGEDVELKARPVTVSQFDIVHIKKTVTDDGIPVIDIDVEVTVSSGTYVRALARDLGAALGTGGHLTSLRRTRIGKVGLDIAKTLEQLEFLAGPAPSVEEAQESRLETTEQPLATIPMPDAAALFLPTRVVSIEDARGLTQGKFIDRGETDTITAALTPHRELIAIIEPFNETSIKPKVVFPWEA